MGEYIVSQKFVSEINAFFSCLMYKQYSLFEFIFFLKQAAKGAIFLCEMFHVNRK